MERRAIQTVLAAALFIVMLIGVLFAMQASASSTDTTINGIGGAISLVNNDTNIVITTGVNTITLGLNSVLTAIQTIDFTISAACPASTITFICSTTSPAPDTIYNNAGSGGGHVFKSQGTIIANLANVGATFDVAITDLVNPGAAGLILEPNAAGSSPFLQFTNSAGTAQFCLGWQSSPNEALWEVGSGCGKVAIQAGAGGNIGLPNGIINNYNGIATQGNGVPAIYAVCSMNGKTAAVTNCINYTPPATAGSYRLCWSIDVTASTTENFHLVGTWDDASGNEISQTLGGFDKAGSGLVAGAITNAIGAGVYTGCSTFSIDNSADAITLSTAGTFTSVTYNFDAELEQVQ